MREKIFSITVWYCTSKNKLRHEVFAAVLTKGCLT